MDYSAGQVLTALAERVESDDNIKHIQELDLRVLAEFVNTHADVAKKVATLMGDQRLSLKQLTNLAIYTKLNN